MHHSHMLLFLSAGSMLTLAACSGSKNSSRQKPTCTWQAQAITVDGDNRDWPSPYPLNDSKAQIGYATSNDGKNLYITMESGDVMTMMKILRAGMTVWIDTGGAKNQSMAINYPLPAEHKMDGQENRQEGQEAMQNMDREKRMQERARKMAADAVQLSLDGFAGCNGGSVVSQNNSCGITVRMAVDEYNSLVWEASIPFKTLYGKEQLDKSDAGRPISVCFEIKGMKWQHSNRQDGNEGGGGRGMRGGGGMNAGGGMRGGGMRGGGMHGGAEGNNGSSERQNMSEASKTWYRFGLAYKG